MPVVRVNFAPRELVSTMQDMRAWLDSSGVEPSRFKYHRAEGVMLLEFAAIKPAQAFAERFSANLLPEPGAGKAQ